MALRRRPNPPSYSFAAKGALSAADLAPTAEAEADVRRQTQRARIASVHEGSRVVAEALIAGYRAHGFRLASIDPLYAGAQESASIAELDPHTYGNVDDESARYVVNWGGVEHTLGFAELLARLHSTYCGTIAIDCAHLRAGDQRTWLYRQFEARAGTLPLTDPEAMGILAQLVAAETFEHYQRERYPKHKQFSLEGSESIVTLLAEVVEEAARNGVEDAILGMPHRGRLNMLKNVFHLPARQLFSLFAGAPDPSLAAWDLKDHLGYSTRRETAHGSINLVLAHNPSHLESVSPVICGMARALQDRKAGGFGKKVMPILIHGDASFSGQGVVTETLNLSQTRGYSVGGTVHLILNNQIGSTISHPRDSRSTAYCGDFARAIDAPVVHVNADDPEAVVLAARLATGYRLKFGADIIVDHVGYRRHGHFGGDDPTMTQPARQRRIRSQPSIVSLYADELAQRGLVRDGDLERLKAAALAELTAPGNGDGTSSGAKSTVRASSAPDPSAERAVVTAVPIEQLRTLVHKLTAVPPGFALHAGIQKLIDGWRSVAGDDNRRVDWCLAENLAYASLLANGFNIRLSGLDVGRGSFFHRYHVWHDQGADTDWQNLYVPLRHVADVEGFFSIFESPLSEEAVMGFEYGYTLRCGRDLVIWEAQFGDFVNNAQVIIDQYIASGERKWGYKSGLVVLLPHGHEGGGPEHSCAYLGRFLQLCAEDNMQVVMPSTAAQYYHLLRRQALTVERKPLIVMTPKTLLYGNAASYARLRDLAEGEFRPVLGEQAAIDPATVARAVIASGKLYYDLVQGRAPAERANVAILRLEQLYPFSVDALAAELQRYPQLREVVWAQEEARNHGAWHLLRDALESTLPAGVGLRYAGRPATAATAVCNAAQHAAEQSAVVDRALGPAPA
jgi:2-oxoglutarate dehydrogenase E1 component